MEYFLHPWRHASCSSLQNIIAFPSSSNNTSTISKNSNRGIFLTHSMVSSDNKLAALETEYTNEQWPDHIWQKSDPQSPQQPVWETKPKSLQQSAQNDQDLVNDCQFPYILPWLLTQDQALKAKYVPQIMHTRCLLLARWLPVSPGQQALMILDLKPSLLFSL